MKTIALRHAVRVNQRVLPDTTPQDFRFKYVDISQVNSNGEVTVPERYTTFGTAPSRARRLANPGSLIVSTVRTYLRAIAVVPSTEDTLVFSTGFAVLDARSGMDSRFRGYACRSNRFIEEIVARSVGISYPAINPGDLGAVAIPFTELDEQRQIADFLDARVSRIDNIVSGRRLQLADMRAWLRSFVNSVTLSAFSGNLGTRLKLLYDVIDERAGDRDLQLLSVSIHRRVVPRSTMTLDEARAEDLSSYKITKPGDIVLNRMRAFQGAIGLNRVLGIVSPDYLVLRPKSVVRADWLHYVFRSDWFVGEMITRLRGIGSVELGSVRTPRINASDLGQIKLAIPDLDEQGLAVDRLAAVQESTDTAVDALQRSIALLSEYKQSLISAAMAGELDVTTASGAMPA